MVQLKVGNKKKGHSKLYSSGALSEGLFIIKSFFHYFKGNVLVALGVAISTMVLTGSLIIGDSVRHSLTQATFYRLGETTHLVSVRERYFRQEMAEEMEAQNPQLKAVPILLLEGVAVADGGQERANKVQIVGVNKDFSEISNADLFDQLNQNEIAISENLAQQLKVTENDNLMVRIKKASLIPLNAPFISAEETSVSLRATIKKVVTKEELGRFSLKNSQTAPFNIFLSIDRLNQMMDFEGKANQILVVSQLENKEIQKTVKACLTPEDAGLKLKNIERTGEVEISTERVFMEDEVAKALQKLPDAEPVLTYFVNEISEYSTSDKRLSSGLTGNQSSSTISNQNQLRSIPYSFVSTIASGLSGNGIVLNRWAADDLQATVGDSIRLEYFEIGPLRQLQIREASFVLQEIVPMSSSLCDPDRVPNLPGLSDAGHCREWEAGVPINLDDIRDTDEEYWEDYKGTPKAFISMDEALKLWSNRFGNYTAFRFPKTSFDSVQYFNVFAENIAPADLGMLVEPIRQQGVESAQNGTDFSGLFIGLSFFILVAAIILTALLFRLNLETRSSQIGLLAALGFQQNQIRRFYLSEGLVTALFGALLGTIISAFYTQLVFRILNTLWFDIVRTNVLEINILAATVSLGFVISVVVSLFAIFISVRQFQKKQIAELQKSLDTARNQKLEVVYSAVLWVSLLAGLVILTWQLVLPQQDPSMFFISGGLFLIAFLLLTRLFLLRQQKRKRTEFGTSKLARLNLTRNIRRSLTIVILFALGTFITVSTGSNKLDLFANAQNKTSGTGGFLFFAETTMPVLFDINDPAKRADEGMKQDFNILQLRRLDGDNASCLNLNRIAQPAILGVDSEALNGRFSFASKIKSVEGDPWTMLEQESDDGTIPAIADQTVIQWGLMKKIGDVLLYQNEQGDTLKLKLVAGTSPSIFQGYVIISNQNFLKNYPSSSGSNLFLIDGLPESEQAIGDELQSTFRDYGWEMELAAKRLVEFYSVTNTYLSIFLALGTLGLILGTIGLAVILARTLLERKREIALMQAIGFKVNALFRILIGEYLILLVSGVLIGFATALLATLPSFLSTNTDASISTVVILVALIILNGLIWITGLSWYSLQKKSLVTELRNE